MDDVKDLEKRIEQCKIFYAKNSSSFMWNSSFNSKITALKEDLEIRLKKAQAHQQQQEQMIARQKALQAAQEKINIENPLTSVKLLVNYTDKQ